MTSSALATVTTIYTGMNKSEAHKCLEELLEIYNEAAGAEKLKLVSETNTPAPNYRRRRGGRAEIWCKVVSSVPNRASFSMKEVDGDAVWHPYDFSDKPAGAIVAGGRSGSGERFLGIVKPGADSEFCGVNMTGVGVAFETEDNKKFLKELASQFGA